MGLAFPIASVHYWNRLKQGECQVKTGHRSDNYILLSQWHYPVQRQAEGNIFPQRLIVRQDEAEKIILANLKKEGGDWRTFKGQKRAVKLFLFVTKVWRSE